jgi:hypothetical protein
MNFQALHDHLRAIDAPGLVSADEPRPADKKAKDPGRAGQSFVVIEARRIVDFLRVCRDDPTLGFELLSLAHRHRLSFLSFIHKENASLRSATAVYRAAQWHERECGEMYGITFEGHPDPRNILLPDDWVGYPMRKDYEFPKEYHGISCE